LIAARELVEAANRSGMSREEMVATLTGIWQAAESASSGDASTGHG
jgi:hypothetical protein